MIQALLLTESGVAAPPVGITLVQAVPNNSGASTSGSITVPIVATVSGNLIFVGVLMSNATQVLTPSATGTAQTFTSIGTSSPLGSGQLACWYVKNCASGSTSVVVTRASGSGSWSAIVYEVSGLSASSPLDVTAQSYSQGSSPVSTGTTASSTTANEFWIALCGQFGPPDGSTPTFSAPGGSWIGAGTTSSALVGAVNNSAIGYAYQIRTSTGAASATMAVTPTFSDGGQGMAVTFK